MTESSGPPELPGYWPPVSQGEPVGPARPVDHGPPASGYGPPPPGPRTVNLLAVFAVVAIFVLPPAALVLGWIARNEILKTGQRGAAMAWAGILVGALFTVLYVVAAVIAIMVLGSGDWYG